MATTRVREGRTIVATVLAIGICTAINLIVIAVLYDAIFSEGPGLSENATQILSTTFGGILGVLGAYIGFRAGQETSEAGALRDAEQHVPTSTPVPTSTSSLGPPPESYTRTEAPPSH